MPIYFEMRSEADALQQRSSADALSEILQDALGGLEVRVVSIRPARDRGYVYACAARSKPDRGAVVERLRADPRLRKFAFSDEAEAADGPFGWHRV
jgi:hypothetical protein